MVQMAGPAGRFAKIKSQLQQFPLLCHWAQGQNQVPQAGGLESRNVCSPSTRGWKSKIKVTAGTVFPEASLFGMEMTVFSCVITWSSLCVSLCPDLFLEGHQSDWIMGHP